VFCNGVEVMTVGGTKESYNVDIYSGNHPFYTQVRRRLFFLGGRNRAA
jgi:large subunit ribosomal protein L31